MSQKLNSKKLTVFQENMLSIARQIKEYKLACEANICSILYKKPSLLRESNLTLNDFSNNEWKVYFAILYGIIITEKKNAIDEVIIGIYLEKHHRLQERYNEYGGFDTIQSAGEYVKEETFDGYVADLRKWNAVLSLTKKGWVSKSKLSEYADMTAEEIYDEYQIYINDIFANVDNEVKSYDIREGLYDLIDELDQGFGIGLPYADMPLLSKETGGQYLGSITLVGGLSNTGKSTFVRATCLTSVIENGQKIVVMLNEEGYKKWQRELLVSVVNNVLHKDMQKHIVRDGAYTDETKAILREAADWIQNNIDNHAITIIPLEHYTTNKAIKIIKKYASMGVDYFVIDTFKLDANMNTDNSWLKMQQNMVAINDTIKPEAANVHIMITFQLAKGSTRTRYYAQDNIGVSKNIADVASTCIMLRKMFDDEMPGEKNELKVFKILGETGRSKIPVQLQPNRNYQILFITKNREGTTDYQIVLEHDLSRNILKEVGYTKVPMDAY